MIEKKEIERHYIDYILSDVLEVTPVWREWYNDHSLLIDHLFHVGFFSLMEDDINREKDGLFVRKDYPFYKTEKHIHDVLDMNPVSIFEVLVGVALRLNPLMFGTADSEEPPADLSFRILCTNLGLDKFDDHLILEFGYSKIDEILFRFMERKYDGCCYSDGSLFPCPGVYGKPCRDDDDYRERSIWYQMQHFVD